MTHAPAPAASTARALWDPGVLVDPHPMYRRLRASDPVHRSPLGPWVLTRHADVLAVLRDPRFGREGFERHFVPDGPARPAAGAGRSSMLFRDPPHHARLRESVARAFTPRAVEALRPALRAHVDAQLDRALRATRFDAMAELAEPLPATVMGEWLGIPAGDRPALAAAAATVAAGLDALPIPEDRPLLAAGQAARRALGAYFRDAIAARRARPRPDLLGGLVEAAERDGLLTDAEVVAMAVLLWVAGIETTASLIGTTLWALLGHPEELARVRAEPWRVPAALEEALRWESPVQRTWRVAQADVPLGGVTIPAGALVVLALGAANRDPARFADPDRFDLRRPAPAHLAFGAGPHFCLGAALGRVQAELAIGALLGRCPDLRLASPAPVWRPTATVRRLAALPVRSTP